MTTIPLYTKIARLRLKINNSPLEPFINKLYSELADRGITFRPRCYLSDEWGCPHKIPVIAIPFYLADKKLSSNEKKMTGVAAENPREIMMYLRHETGHAINYAFRLYKHTDWHQIFGLFSRPYKEHYKRVPHDPRFVTYLPDWYAQKHPDEDFAETFALWLDPRSAWRKGYAQKPAFKKLLYIEESMKIYGTQKPFISKGKRHRPLSVLSMTLSAWYKQNKKEK